MSVRPDLRRQAGSGDRRVAGRWQFPLRWVLAVALAMSVSGGIEYALAVSQLERRTLAEAAESYAADLDGLTDVLSAGLPPTARRDAVLRELERVAQTYGTRAVLLFDADGRLLQATGGTPRTDESKTAEIRAVLASGGPAWEEERDPGEADQAHRYEFLLPVRTSAGQDFVVEVDQQAGIVEDLLADLRMRKVYGTLLGMLVAVPLSYLLGGRSLRRRQTRAEHAADTDALTGLAGRRPFRPAVQLALSDRAAGPAVLALIDLDEFKGVNDRSGHSYGDHVLCALARSFDALEGSSTAFRLGGDEFAILLTGRTDEQAVAEIERVRQALADTVPGITFSCGIAATTGGEQVSLDELWERADSALYEAKHRGRRRTVCFSAMAGSISVSADKLDAVSGLLADDAALSVAFQPIWDLNEGHVLGHEALLRLPVGTCVAGPQEAFDLAHRLGSAAALDARARRAVLQVVASQDWHGLLFLNIHPDALPGLDVDALVDQLTLAGLAPQQVVLEVTEHDGLDRPEPVRVLKRAHARGFRLALDDMGAGNAGLRALTLVRFDVVKLDRQVIARLGIDPASNATVAAAVTFVQQTGGWVVAEGIENDAMLRAVLDDTRRVPHDAPLIAGQGYLLGRPGPAPTAPGAQLPHLLTAQLPHLPTH